MAALALAGALAGCPAAVRTMHAERLVCVDPQGFAVSDSGFVDSVEQPTRDRPAWVLVRGDRRVWFAQIPGSSCERLVFELPAAARG